MRRAAVATGVADEQLCDLGRVITSLFLGFLNCTMGEEIEPTTSMKYNNPSKNADLAQPTWHIGLNKQTLVIYSSLGSSCSDSLVTFLRLRNYFS